MKMWKKAASVNPELIDKRENLSVDSGLFFKKQIQEITDRQQRGDRNYIIGL